MSDILEVGKQLISMWLDIIFDYFILASIVFIPYLLFIYISSYDPHQVLLYVFYAMTALILFKKVLYFIKD